MEPPSKSDRLEQTCIEGADLLQVTKSLFPWKNGYVIAINPKNKKQEKPFRDHTKHCLFSLSLVFIRSITTKSNEKSKFHSYPSLGGCRIRKSVVVVVVRRRKIPFVADKEPISALAAEYQSGSPILLEKIKILGEQYAAIRRTRGDGNCFFRSFMFSYLEHILDSQDQAEVDRIKAKVEECRKTLQSLGYTDFTFEDFFALFLEQLDSVLQGNESSISHDELIIRSRDQSISDYVVMFFRFVTAGEIRKRSEFFEPFVMGLSNGTVEQFCKSAVEPMGEESDHVHITALSDALGVPIRVVYLDRSSCDTGGVSATMTFSTQSKCNCWFWTSEC
ncbi:hypothetical protein Q3G72_002909 [Acer saccharum]|nr:hypothetical protein Q3G72_002909 [Acer saccharum]